MKILDINFEKWTVDNKLHSGIVQDYTCAVQYCVEKKRKNFALIRESREYAHDVWEDFFMVVDVRYDVEYNARNEQDAKKKFAELVKNGAPYDRRVACEVTIAEMVASRN